MSITPFFLDLHAAYQAELDDLATDSEGRDVLQQRLREKRGEIAFLVQMMEVSPEMVAGVFHRGFQFREPAVMEQLLTLEADEFPDWDDLEASIALQPWAMPLAEVVLEQAAGAWFLTVAAALDYLQSRRVAPLAAANESDDEAPAEDGEARPRAGGDDPFDDDDRDDADDEALREEAGADWLAEQGFDRKE